ncbi:hypothetical protein EB836_10555 [Brevibacterium sp. S111]|nr:hypothetical protein EB836_10555 [Brevibacterium sp. S111]
MTFSHFFIGMIAGQSASPITSPWYMRSPAIVGLLMICRIVAVVQPRECSEVGFIGVGTPARLRRVTIWLIDPPSRISSTAETMIAAFSGSIS